MRFCGSGHTRRQLMESLTLLQEIVDDCRRMERRPLMIAEDLQRDEIVNTVTIGCVHCWLLYHFLAFESQRKSHLHAIPSDSMRSGMMAFSTPSTKPLWPWSESVHEIMIPQRSVLYASVDS